jgi:dipeptidyl aminopeptidase/acylaminoacyl peptidase
VTWKVALCCGALTLAACKNEASGSGGQSGGLQGLGTRVFAGEAIELRVSPDGQWTSFLQHAQKPRMDGIPDLMVLGELTVVPTTGGSARIVGEGVTNIPGGWLFSPDSKHLLYITGYQPVGQSGALSVLPLSGGDPKKIGEAVTYMLISPDSRALAFVDKGVLKLGPLPSGPFREVSGEVSNVRFSPKGDVLAFKRKLVAAGGLFLVDVANEKASPKKLVEQVADFDFSPDGATLAFNARSPQSADRFELAVAQVSSGKVTRIAEHGWGFVFSPDSKWLARIEESPTKMPGRLVVGPSAGGAGRKLGEKVFVFEFSPDSSAIAFLDRFDFNAGNTMRARGAGVITVATLPDGAPKQVSGHVPNFSWSQDSKSIAFLERFFKPVYTVDLMHFSLGQDKPVKVYPGVFGYGFTREHGLLFRTNCIREARACDLYQANLADLKVPPKKWLEGIYNFKTCGSEERMLITYAQMKADAYDVAVYNTKTGKHQTVDRNVAVPALCTKENAPDLAYIVKDLKRLGVYVASQGLP